MRKTLLLLVGVLVLASSAGAWVVPGSDNELVNGDFEHPNDPWYQWQHGTGLGYGLADNHGTAVYCKDPGGNLLLRQIVDETYYSGWDQNGSAKWIDLSAEILCEDLSSPPASAVMFGIDWWYTQDDDPPQDPPDGEQWVTINFNDIAGYRPSEWFEVHPFNPTTAWNTTLFANFQPRWVSVECRLIQGPGETVWVDNFVLNAECVPEPSVLVAILSGLGGLGALRAFKRK